MAGFGLPVVVLVAAAVLAHSAVVHLRHPATLSGALARQDLLPRRLASIVAAALGPAEGALALGAVAALALDRATVAIGAAVAVAGATFLVFLLVLRIRRPDAPCGCSGHLRAPGTIEVLRAAAVLVGGMALLGDAAGRLRTLDGAEVATVAMAAVATALALELATVAPAREPAP